MSESFIFAHFLFFGERCERVAHNRSFSLIDVSESLRLLTKNEWCEWIAQVTNQKWATMSDSLTWLRGNERSRSNRSGRSPKMSLINCTFDSDFKRFQREQTLPFRLFLFFSVSFVHLRYLVIRRFVCKECDLCTLQLIFGKNGSRISKK